MKICVTANHFNCIPVTILKMCMFLISSWKFAINYWFKYANHCIPLSAQMNWKAANRKKIAHTSNLHESFLLLLFITFHKTLLNVQLKKKNNFCLHLWRRRFWRKIQDVGKLHIFLSIWSRLTRHNTIFTKKALKWFDDSNGLSI